MRAPRGGFPSILAVTVLYASMAAAQPVTLDGITFSDERGGFTIIGASGSGTLEDPFVVVEEITGPTAAILVIRGFSTVFGNRIGTYHPTGFALRKIVTNRTPFVWPIIDFELQQELGVASDTFDGLSFAQGASSGRPFSSDRFARTTEIHEPLDYISFHDGLLRPGETAMFDVVVTDTTPIAVFFLIQRPNRPLARFDTDARSAPAGPPNKTNPAVVGPGAVRLCGRASRQPRPRPDLARDDGNGAGLVSRAGGAALRDATIDEDDPRS